MGRNRAASPWVNIWTFSPGPRRTTKTTETTKAPLWPSRLTIKRRCGPPLVVFGRTLAALEARCPDLVPIDRWQLAVQDGRRFLARWGEQAEALGWTAKDLFGLLTVPEHAKPSFNRLSRYDETGLIWLLNGRRVVALTEATAAIQGPTGAVTVYRRNKPALGPRGDSLDDRSMGTAMTPRPAAG